MATVPRWQTVMSKALSEPKNSTVIQLATVDKDNRPHVRSVGFHSFLSHSLILLVTDIRTPKATHIHTNSHVELVWWIESTQEQFRIAGRASLAPAPSHPYYQSAIDWEQKRREVYNGASDSSRAFCCRPTPGNKLEGGYERAKEWPVKLPKLDEATNEEEKKNLEYAFENFALIIIDPYEVDYVELGKMPHQRTKFMKEDDGKWVEQIVVP